MLHAAIWITAAIVLAFWSVAAWLLVEAAQRGPAWVEQLADWAARQTYGRWLDDWLPGWLALLRALAELMHTLLGWLGVSAPWWPGLLWAAGVVAVLLVACAFSLFVVLLTPARGAARSAPRS
jgi:hypothetical protein